MALVNFRNINHESRKRSGQDSRQAPKLSFRKLAAGQRMPAKTGQPRINTRPAKNNNHRKLLYDDASDYLNQARQAVKNRESFALEPGFEILQKMAEIDDPRDELFIMAIHRDNRLKYVLHHSVNVAIYAMKMAANFGFNKIKKLEIAMAALLHDIGMAIIPDKVIYKQQAHSQKEIKLLRQGPNYSYKILRSFGNNFAYLAESAAQVYERIDGSGYPRGLQGDEIHEYAQIIGLLDLYETLIHSRPQREKLTHFSAVKEIINTCKTHFQRNYLKSLLSIFTVFPIHSYVRLNSNAIGKVIETYPDQPMRPRLQIIYDSHGRKVLTERIVSLPENPLLNIVDSVSKSEIQELSEAQSGVQA